MKNSKTSIIPKGEKNIYQVFGHTQLKTFLMTDKWSCIDCKKGFIIDSITNKIVDLL